MSTPILTSQLKYSEILAVFQDYADYDLEGSLARAKVYIKAGRMLMSPAIRRSGMANRAEEVELEPEIIERSVQAAVTWFAIRNHANADRVQYIPSPDWRDE